MVQLATAPIAAALGGGAIATAVAQVGVGLAISAVVRAQQGRASSAIVSQIPGIRSETTTAGGVNSQNMILGRYVTAGNLVAPRMSHGEVDDTPNAYRTIIADVSDVPVTGLVAAFVNEVNLNVATVLDGTPHPDYGLSIGPTGFDLYRDKIWVKFYDGTQTAADPMLLSKYASRDERPWQSDMVLDGVAYAIVTMKFDRDVWQSDPQLRFVVDGIAVYDPRKDTSIGGSGSHRYGDDSTYEFSRNPMVLVYNILRGIQVDSATRWGLDVAAENLPLSTWAAAMNACDAASYEAGFDVLIARDDPLDVVDELLKACSGDIADVGGTWYARAGAVQLPVAYITDGDILRDSPQTMDMFPELDSRINTITGSCVAPDAKWTAQAIPERQDADALAQDGMVLAADINLPAVTDPVQGQRLTQAWLRDAQKMIRHDITLGPRGLLINPLDAISWTSDLNQYDDKRFEVHSRAIDPLSLSTTFALRERNPDDYDWQAADELPVFAPSEILPVPAAQTVPNFALSPAQVLDGSGQNRRPALRLTWSGDLPDVRTVKYQVRVQGQPGFVAQGNTHDVDGGEAVVRGGILPNTTYEARARLVTDRPTEWTAWASATTPDIRIGGDDIATTYTQALTDAIDGAQTSADNAASDVLDILNRLSDASILVDIGGGVIQAYRFDDNANSTVVLLNGDNVIAPGTLATNRLVVGLGANLLRNANFAQGLSGWQYIGSGARGGETTMSLRAAGTDYAGATFETLLLFQNGTAISGTSEIRSLGLQQDGTALSGAIPVAVDEWYEGSVQASSLRSSGEVLLRFRDSGGNNLGGPGSFIPLDTPDSISNPDRWPRYWVKGQAPAGAVTVELILRKYGTDSGASSSVTFHKPQVARSTQDATEPMPFSPEGTSLIDGGAIIANSITAQTAAIADAAIDTLQVADRAITGTTLYAALAEVTYATPAGFAAFNSTYERTAGYQTEMTFSMDVSASVVGVDPAKIEINLSRDGTAIRTLERTVQPDPLAPGDSRLFLGTIILATIDTSTAGGTTTYGYTISLSGSGWTFKIKNRQLRLKQGKR